MRRGSGAIVSCCRRHGQPDVALVIHDVAAVDTTSIHGRRELTAFARLVGRSCGAGLCRLEQRLDFTALRNTHALATYAVRAHLRSAMASPHDRLFKSTFQKLEHMRSELESVLPAEIVARIDWTTLRLESGELVDRQLELLESDLLFTANIDGAHACIYVLFEHQSTVDATMPLRLLRYMTRIWEHFASQHRGMPLPLIVPVVLHHGSREWNAPLRFADLIDVPSDLRLAAAPFIPDFTFVLDDLSKLDDAALRRRALTALAQLTLVVMQRCRAAPNPLELLKPWADVAVAVLTAPNGAEALGSISSYISRVAEVPLAELRAFFRQLGPKAEEVFVTTAEQIAEQARLQTQAATLLKLLTLKFGPLDEARAEQVRGARGEDLEAWLERVLTATTVEGVFGN